MNSSEFDNNNSNNNNNNNSGMNSFGDGGGDSFNNYSNAKSGYNDNIGITSYITNNNNNNNNMGSSMMENSNSFNGNNNNPNIGNVNVNNNNNVFNNNDQNLKIAPLSRKQNNGSRNLARPNPMQDGLLVQAGDVQSFDPPNNNAAMSTDRVQVSIGSFTNNRPLEVDVEVWQPNTNNNNNNNNAPSMRMRVESEDGIMRPFHAVLETLSSNININNNGMNGDTNAPCTITVRNYDPNGSPIYAAVTESNVQYRDYLSMLDAAQNNYQPNNSIFLNNNNGPNQNQQRSLEGQGAMTVYSFDDYVDSVQVLLTTDGKPLNAKIELLQQDGSFLKQVIQLYTENGLDRPFFAVLETPGGGNVVRVVNTGSMVEEGLTAVVDSYGVVDGSGSFQSYNQM